MEISNQEKVSAILNYISPLMAGLCLLLFPAFTYSQKYDPSVLRQKMTVVGIDYEKVKLYSDMTYKSKTRVTRYYIQMGTSSTPYVPSGKTMGKYFKVVPKAYEIYKGGRRLQVIGNYLTLASIATLITGQSMGINRNNRPLQYISGGLFMVGWYTAFTLAAKGRKRVLYAVPIYNKEMGFE